MRLMHLPLAALVLISLCNASPVTKQNKEDGLKDEDYRLPNTIKPHHYEIELTPYLKDEEKHEAFTFDGKCTITFEALNNDIKKIVLHRSKEMKIVDPKEIIPKDGGKTIEIEKTDYVNVTEFYTLKLSAPLEVKKNYTITFEYLGVMNDQMSGFYRSSYEEKGVTKWIATTQFQPAHARKAFPCFDEPRFKARFDVSIVREKHMHTLGNMDHKDKGLKAGQGRVKDVFETTPLMSTYLLAFIVSEFQSVSNKTREDFDVWARPDAISQGKYSYEIGKKTLEHLEKFTGYKYKVQGMEKMDMVALPDFSAGAMENWGLLTFRETALLYDEKVSTELAKQRVATVVAHEQAHMWFGDLVTCDWWEHTWLNEGFARYLQYYAADQAEPQWNLMDQFVVEQQQAVFGMDALTTAKALSSSVGNPDSISAHFDSISYNKGASVIRMMEHVVGTETFQSALKEYLKKNEFKTVVPEDLFESMQTEVNKNGNKDKINITAIMQNWVYKTGYPVINVSQDDDKMTVKQSRFLLHANKTAATTKYFVPLSYTSKSKKEFKTKPKAFMNDTEETIMLDLPNADHEWVIFNVHGSGYYRVNYDQHTWDLLSKALKEDKFDGIPVLNRAQLIDDALNLARAEGGLLKYEIALNLLDYLKKEVEYLPWTAAFQGLDFLYKRLSPIPENRVSLEAYIRGLMEKLYDHHQFKESEKDNPVMKYNRAQTLAWACKIGHKECIDEAKYTFQKFQQNTSDTISPNLRPTVYCNALRHGNETHFEFLWERFQRENVAAEQVLILTAMGCTKDKDKLNWYLQESVKEGSKIRKQDASSVFTGVYSGNPENVRVAFDFLKENYKKIANAYAGMNALGNAISGLAQRLTTEDEVKELEKFLKEHAAEMGNAAETAAEAIKSAETALEWNKDNAKSIMQWIRDNTSGSSLVVGSVTACLLAVTVALLL